VDQERDQEHQGQVEMPDELAEHVGREPEEPATDEGCPEAPAHPAAEQKRGEGGEHGAQQRGEVEGEQRTGERGEGREQEGRGGDAGAEGEIEALWDVDEVGVEGVEAVQDRVWPPGEGPDVDTLVGSGTDALRSASVMKQRRAEQE
jgi:hypothetical protein